ncbi:MAG: iron-containing alcohol dehydrogenase [Desulfococcaceae bacterium]
MKNKAYIVDPQQCLDLCTCGKKHPVPETLMYAGEDAFAVLAFDCAKTVRRERVLVIEDENTHEAAGREVTAALRKNAVAYKNIILPGDIELTDELAGRIFADSDGFALIIAVGAGTINDLGKTVSTRRKIPYWTVPTAPSMNGYTSSIAAIKVRGVKRTLPAVPPRFVYANPRVIRSAPLKLCQSGFCDLLAKSVSDTDWQTESLLFSGSYCSLSSSVVGESEHLYLLHPDKIRNGDGETLNALFKGLLISGAAMTLAGSSAPASGGEHLLSHFWDMRESITGRKPELHGLQVGAGVILSAMCYEKLAAMESWDLQKRAEDSFQADLDRIPLIWGKYAEEVRKRFLQKKEYLMKFDTLLPENRTGLQELFRKVRKAGFFLDLIRSTGFGMKLRDLNLTEEEFRLAALNARAIRERITVLDIAARAGILEAAGEETLELLNR